MRLGWFALTVFVLVVASCSDPTDEARPVTIRNDTSGAVVLRVCDSFGCNNLNDRLAPRAETLENVSTDENPYEILVVDASGKRAGCLEAATRPVPQVPIAVSAMTECHR
jgi:hypothetical protein